MRHRYFLTTFYVAALLLTASVKAATFPADFEPRLITSEQGWFLTSSTESSAMGGAYHGLGDINGDGYDDYMAGSDSWAETPVHYLFYGTASGQSLTLDPDTAGQVGAVTLGDAVHAFGVGDFNGDGLDDWILQPVGNLSRGEPLNSPEGDAYLVLGQTGRYSSPFNIEQANAGRLIGTSPSDSNGETRVHPAGDFNGDGYADLMILESLTNESDSMDAWLLLGRAGNLPASLDPVNDPSVQKTAIRFPWPEYSDIDTYSIGWVVWQDTWIESGADVNGDGKDDLMVFQSWNGIPTTGSVYVVFGSDAGLPALIDSETLDGSNGFSVRSPFFEPDIPPGQSLTSISFVNDTNGDQIDDLVIANRSEVDSSGKIDLIHGRSGWPSALDLETISTISALTINGARFTPVGNAGDINGDGLGDWFFGNDYPGGISFIYGKQGPAESFSVDELDGIRGFKINPTLESIGYFPAPWLDMRGGDINGDGVDDLLLGNSGSIGLVDDLDVLLDLDNITDPRTGLLMVILGRADQGGPSSPFNTYPSYARQFIEVRWEATAQPSLAGFEIFRDGGLIASVGADARRYEDLTAARDTAYTYEIVGIDSVGQRSAPVIVRALNDHEHYPVLAGEVYSDTLAELFWVDEGNNPFFGNREYAIYRDGVYKESLRALSWLDRAYNGVEHTYYIETNPQRFRDEYRLRSNSLRLPPQAGSRGPASVRNLYYMLANPSELLLLWKPASWGVEPLRYEILGGFDGSELLGTTSGLHFLDRLENTDQRSYFYYVVTVDANGRRSSPLPIAANITSALQKFLPQQPINIKASETTKTSITLQWDLDPTGTDPDSYEIIRDGNVIGSTTEMSYTASGLQADTYYNFEVIAVSDKGLRSLDMYTGTVGIITAGGPFAPAKVDAFAYGPSTVEVIWARAETAATYATQYDVYRDGQLIKTVDALSLIERDLTPGTSYQYSVRSVSIRGQRSDTEVSVSVTTPTM